MIKLNNTQEPQRVYIPRMMYMKLYQGIPKNNHKTVEVYFRIIITF